MSEADDEGLPPFAQPYLEDFRRIEKILERTTGFLLLPVESTSPDLGLVFGHWLKHRGRSAEIYALEEPATLATFTSVVGTAQASPRRVVIALGPRDGGGPEFSTMLGSLNMARDRIAKALDAPLLWWGDEDFHLATWRGAADFWSIAATPFRLGRRSLTDGFGQMPGTLWWWTGAANVDRKKLNEELEEARQTGDRRQVARVQLRLAESRLVDGDVAGARQALDDADPDVRESAPNLRSRWEMLDRAASEDEPLTIEGLRDQIQRHQGLGAQRAELHDRVRLADLIGGRPEAKAELLRARELASGLGDLGARLEIDMRLLFEPPFALATSLLGRIATDTALAAEALSSPEDRARASLVLARLALLRGDLERAERLASEALARAVSAGRADLELHAHALKSGSAYAAGRYEECLTYGSEWSSLAEDSDSLWHAEGAHAGRAEALRRLGRPHDAAKELLAVAVLEEAVARTGDTERLWTDLALCAHEAKADDAAALFAVNAVLARVHRPAFRSALDAMLRMVDPRIAEPARLILSDKPEAIRGDALRALEDAHREIQANAAKAGIDPMNPDTWPRAAATPSPA